MEIKQLILDKIKAYDTIIIHGHMRPDGDCYGSTFGLKGIIETTFPEKKVYVVGQTSGYVSFVGTPDTIEDSVYEGALSFVCDTATEDRISDKRYRLAKEVIKIDHHIPNEDSYYADHYWIEEEKPSCSQMIASFFKTFQSELKLNHAGAQAMYVGILTDTGRFRFRGVDRDTHEMAGLLLDFGVDVEYVDYQLSTQTMDQVKLKGHVLSNFKTTENGFIYFVMTRDIITKYNVTDEDAASMVSNLGGIEGYPVWALIIEYETDIRIRLRSRNPEIESLARKYDGGGHSKAAGASLKSWDELDQFVKDVDQHILDNKE